jgi:hypothetical protein
MLFLCHEVFVGLELYVGKRIEITLRYIRTGVEPISEKYPGSFTKMSGGIMVIPRHIPEIIGW